jgi:predicted transcriptional regulator
MSNRDDLVAEIEAFLARTGMTESQFGVEAVNNPALMHYLYRGRDLRLTTVERLREFMRTYKPRPKTKSPRKRPKHKGHEAAA